MTRSHANNERVPMKPNPTTASALPHRALGVFLALACALTACLALAATPVAAKVVHTEEGRFNGEGRPAEGSFGGGSFQYVLPSDAVDQSSGDVWVTEALYFGFAGKANVIDKFTEKGAYAGVQILGTTTPQGSFNFGYGFFAGIAVDNSSAHPGTLYVSDTFNHVVDRFNGTTGAFECQITGKIPGTTEEEEHECNGAAGSQPTSGPGIEPAGLAVDSAGDLYVADYAGHAIDEFGPSGQFKRQITSPELGKGNGLGTIAIDSTGDLYVTNFEEDVVKFHPDGSFAEVINKARPTGVGVDPSNDHVYVSSRNPAEENEQAILEYEPSASGDVLLDTVAAGQNLPPFGGLAVGPGGKLYASAVFSFTGAEVFIYSGDTVVPNVTTEAATEVEESSATLHGHLDPDAAHGGGEVETCQFEFGQTEAYGETAPCSPGPNYSNPTDVSAALTGLRPSTTYHFRLEAANSNRVPAPGEDQTFTTPGPPAVDHEAAEAMTNYAVVIGRINPWGYDTTCDLQFVAEPVFEGSGWANAGSVPCSPEDLGSGFGDVRTMTKITGLSHHTTYHYRLLATNRAGLSESPAGTFETYGIDEASVESLKNSQNSGPTGWEPGEPEGQAGAHPYEVVSSVELSHTTVFSKCFANPSCYNEDHEPIDTEFINYTGVNTKDIVVPLPPGLVGNPNALKQCSHFLLAQEQCPGDTQVGTIELWTDDNLNGGEGEELPLPSSRQGNPAPLYNVTPSGQFPAEFGAFIEGQAPAYIQFNVRTGEDYGVTASSVNLVSTVVLSKARVRVWGVPASPVHDAERLCPSGNGSLTAGCSSDLQPKPLLTSPTSCDGPQPISASVDSWQEPGVFIKTNTEMEGFTGCNQLQFKPSLGALPTTNVADSPSGLHVDLHVPQDENSEGYEDPEGLATADLKDAKVVLPQGIAVNPSSANGLGACSPAQIELHGPKTPTCPDASTIGRVEVDTPLVDHPLPGAVYVATPHDNPFNSLLAIYVVVDDPATGVIIKLPGHIEADPNTGQLTTTFDENPQLPFEDFKLDFFGGARGVLRTPATCGEYQGSWTLTPWSAPESGPPAQGKSPFAITQAPAAAAGTCPAGAAQEPSAPRFEAGTETPTAGRYSPFILRLHREDGSQELTSIDTTLPPGLTGKLAGVAECPDAAIAAARTKSGAEEHASPSCPSSSEVGTVNVASGAGPAPYWVTGHAYLAGPYKGAPLSLAIVTPAVAGPYDLGDVVVRAALYVDPETTQITVKSDPIPTMLQGIPLDVRTVAVKMDRPQFTLNPTSCEKMSVGGQATSLFGAISPLSSPFQVSDCRSLAFKPKLSLALKGSTHRSGHPALTATLRMPPGEANVASAQVTLPHSEFLEQGHIRGTCLRPQLASHSCPANSVYGFAKAWSPLLDQPLSGPVYLTTGFGYHLPALVADLNGQIEVQLHGKVDSGREDGLRNTFEVVPDAPVSKFVLAMQGGKKGLIVNSEDLCLPKTKRKALADFVAQNGLVARSEPKVKAHCGGKGHGKHGHGKHRR